MKKLLLALIVIIALMLTGCTADEAWTDDIYSDGDVHAKAFYGDGSNLSNIDEIIYPEALPEASEDYRGKIAVIYGTPDIVYICLKNSDTSYSWIQIGTGT